MNFNYLKRYCCYFEYADADCGNATNMEFAQTLLLDTTESLLKTQAIVQSFIFSSFPFKQLGLSDIESQVNSML